MHLYLQISQKYGKLSPKMIDRILAHIEWLQPACWEDLIVDAEGSVLLLQETFWGMWYGCWYIGRKDKFDLFHICLFSTEE